PSLLTALCARCLEPVSYVTTRAYDFYISTRGRRTSWMSFLFSHLNHPFTSHHASKSKKRFGGVSTKSGGGSRRARRRRVPRHGTFTVRLSARSRRPSAIASRSCSVG